MLVEAGGGGRLSANQIKRSGGVGVGLREGATTTGRGAECGRVERRDGGGGGGSFVCLRGVLSTRRLRNYKCSVAREREVLLVRATVVVVALLAVGE